MHSSLRTKLAIPVAAATALLTLAGGLTAAAESPPAPEPARTRTITLVSGDRVRVEATGQISLLSKKDFIRHDGPGGTTVIPLDAVGLMKSGRVDRRLFNVTALARQGYDDATGRRLPSLDNPAALRAAAAEQPPEPKAKRAAEHPVTIRMTGRDDNPVLRPSSTVIGDLDNPGPWYFADAGETIDLPAGRYAAIAVVYSAIKGQFRPAMTSIAQPEFTVAGPRELHFDSRPGRPVGLRVDRPDAQIVQQRIGLELPIGNSRYGMTAGDNSDLYSVETEAPHLNSYYRVEASRPEAALTVTAPSRVKVPVTWVEEDTRLSGRHTLPVVNTGHAGAEDIEGLDLKGKLAVFTLSPGEGRTYGERIRRLAAAGAKAAAVYLTEVHQITAGDQDLPVVLAIGPEGSKLATARVATIEGRPISPYQYDLAFPHLGGTLPARLYHPADRELATVDTGFHALGNNEPIGWANSYPSLGSLEMFDFSSRAPIGTRQIRYLSPAPISWSYGVRYGNQGLRDSSTFQRGYTRQDYGKAALTPALNGLTHWDPRPLATIEDGILRAYLPLRSDSDGHRGFVGDDESSWGDTGVNRLFADGKQVGESTTPGAGDFAVPADAKQLRLTAEVERHSPETWLSTKVTADWTTPAKGDGALPLLTIGFDPAVDLKNTAPAGRRFHLPVNLTRQLGTTGPKPKLRSVDVSYDDGATWHPATLTARGATVTHPAKPTPVSLRATADDAAGNAVTITVIRAYLLR
ncbi:hypothetical protein HPO96_07755 [Kribbella sandramycini]|uniref:PA domain-containing protein n=1 Tax=Kribbella sandramycini TaxID=60450 RepID=A0A7Y4KWY8_9ACTN|nr:hypothetical protein [Kribbella sandramycini]MBB6567252.1 hypothetical protein [Kribbella sandramycini]NOL40134.1 hypothetical protein [Kribbella sandramycini]